MTEVYALIPIYDKNKQFFDMSIYNLFEKDKIPVPDLVNINKQSKIETKKPNIKLSSQTEQFSNMLASEGQNLFPTFNKVPDVSVDDKYLSFFFEDDYTGIKNNSHMMKVAYLHLKKEYNKYKEMSDEYSVKRTKELKDKFDNADTKYAEYFKDVEYEKVKTQEFCNKMDEYFSLIYTDSMNEIEKKTKLLKACINYEIKEIPKELIQLFKIDINQTRDQTMNKIKNNNLLSYYLDKNSKLNYHTVILPYSKNDNIVSVNIDDIPTGTHYLVINEYIQNINFLYTEAYEKYSTIKQLCDELHIDAPKNVIDKLEEDKLEYSHEDNYSTIIKYDINNDKKASILELKIVL